MKIKQENKYQAGNISNKSYEQDNGQIDLSLPVAFQIIDIECILELLVEAMSEISNEMNDDTKSVKLPFGKYFGTFNTSMTCCNYICNECHETVGKKWDDESKKLQCNVCFSSIENLTRNQSDESALEKY